MKKNPIRIVTATSLFDGHDASINIMRRILQAGGCEVIHLGHNRSVQDIVNAAIQEDVQGIAISSYQGGHMEFFKYMVDLLKEKNSSHIKIFGGGGGVIVYKEKLELEKNGVTKIYHPDDGQKLGLQGMIAEIIQECDFDVRQVSERNIPKSPGSWEFTDLARAITLLESDESSKKSLSLVTCRKKAPLVVGLTGPGGAGKSSLTDELVQRFLNSFPGKKVAVLCVDPTKRQTGGALLGDRIRMNSLSRPGVFMRSLATRQSGKEITSNLNDVIGLVQNSGFDLIFVETVGTGQSDAAVVNLVDIPLYVMTAEFGAHTQLEKIDMIDLAQIIVVNKFDRRGAEDALKAVKKQYRRSHLKFDGSDEGIPAFGTISSQFNDGGVNLLFSHLVSILNNLGAELKSGTPLTTSKRYSILPPENQNYLFEIVKVLKNYRSETERFQTISSQLGALRQSAQLLEHGDENSDALKSLALPLEKSLPRELVVELKSWDSSIAEYSGDELSYKVRDKVISAPLKVETLSHLKIPRVAPPKLNDWGDRVRFLREENYPGRFPFTAGVFPLKRPEEEPRRQFAGEGPPERTNQRFHLLSLNDEFKRLSTAFDSVTLYGEDPHERPDIYGKIGESGVSVCTLDDMKKLFKGFDLCGPKTSVSMTINGPAPTILAFYLNTAIDQKIEKFENSNRRKANAKELESLRVETLTEVRGTVQADILKEDQAQNTCIFSTEFALKMMGDIQEYFVSNEVKNYYSVSISGYHIAEAGANPITQTAFTLANGFTYVEYYLSRGMKIDDFAQNLSFFFSNGLDPEYAVLGRVARRIWAKVLKGKYGASERSQKLKYHIQTSGRSLHAQEINFNDIRTTLQAFLAINDNCNSLHTNAYDEAITTPTAESVRRAMAIQMIINREMGTTKNENSLQGSYFIENLTDMVESAVMEEFARLAERGGVLGSMEFQYQRSKIQEESLYYENLKHSGKFPIVGVNTFLNDDKEYKTPEVQMVRATKEEKDSQIRNLKEFKRRNENESSTALENLKQVALKGGNIFTELMNATKTCSLGQITKTLFEVGGEYRRSM